MYTLGYILKRKLLLFHILGSYRADKSPTYNIKDKFERLEIVFHGFKRNAPDNHPFSTGLVEKLPRISKDRNCPC